jgi:hypothetical protein
MAGYFMLYFSPTPPLCPTSLVKSKHLAQKDSESGVVVHAYNSSYLGGGDRKIERSRSVWAKGSETLSQEQNKKIPNQKG